MPLVSESRFLATKVSSQEFTNNDQKVCVTNYFDSKLEELKNENREYHASTNSDKSICMRTVRKTGNNDQLEKEISLISYYSRGKDLDPNVVIREDGEINRNYAEREDNLKRSFVCRHLSEAWLAGDLKLSQINSIEDLRQSPMVIKNGDTPEGIKKSKSDLQKRIKVINLTFDEAVACCVCTDDKVDHYFKQYLSETEYADISSLRDKIPTIAKKDEYSELLSYIRSLSTDNNEDLGGKEIVNKIVNIFFNSKTISIIDLHYITYTLNPAIGKLASNSNNDDVYSFSKNSFQPLLRELCETIYTRPEASSESFRWCTRNHAMGLKIVKKDNCLKITFYNPAHTRSHNFVLKSPKDADMVTIPILLSSSCQELYSIIDDGIIDYDDLHVNILTHVQND
jgi:hypothetical protein